ncbi:MAG: hypothetical protein ABL958_08785 [Bdellovibrionia bacterium]
MQSKVIRFIRNAALISAVALSGACKNDPPPPGTGEGPTTNNPAITGFLDSVDGQGTVSGWAVDTEAADQSIEVRLYIDGDLKTPLAKFKADVPRADVNAALKITGDHGFKFAIPDSLKDGKPHTLAAYAFNAKGSKELAQSPANFNISVACRTAGPLVAPLDNEYVVQLRAYNDKWVSAECGGDDTGILNANRDNPGEWETFYISRHSDGRVNVRTSHGRFISAEGGGGGDIHANRPSGGAWESFLVDGALVDGAAVGFKTIDGEHYWSARLDRENATLSAEASALITWERFIVRVISAPVVVRSGVVRAERRTWVDDQGPFYPLGATLFWSLHGWRHERDRLKQNLQFLQRHQWDYVRILAEVDWPEKTIDPREGDYQQVLAEFIDYAYDVCGLRVELTLIGGNNRAITPRYVAERVLPVIQGGREHKIMNIEIANESYGRRLSLEEMYDGARFLHQRLPNLIAISSSEGLDSYTTITDWREDLKRVFVPNGIANLATTHMDRGYGDFGWRAVRQPWDWKDLDFPVSHNEPIGPRSSVAQEDDPVRLAMLRAVGLINGVGAFVLHNAAGVFGMVDPSRNRPANLWEVENIDGIMNAVRGIDRFLPGRVAEGQHWNNGWSGNPWNADAFWGDGADHGVNRNYTVSTADGWVSTVSGVKNFVNLRSTYPSRVEVYDVLQGKVAEVELGAGQDYRLGSLSLDSNGLGAFIVIGHYR